MTNVFEDRMEFIDRDNRQFRTYHKLNAQRLNNKLMAELPPNLIKDKEVLDLGCCIGAAGHWCFHHGAKSYTGVELQPEYYDIMQELLTGQNVELHNECIIDFCNKDDRQWDTVNLAGVLYAFVDYYSVLKAATSKARTYVSIDTLNVRHSNLRDALPLIEVHGEQNINAAWEQASVQGIGCRLNPAALNMIMRALGFVCISSEVPVEDYELYDPKLGWRYVSHFKRANNNGTYQTIQDKLKSKTGATGKW